MASTTTHSTTISTLSSPSATTSSRSVARSSVSGLPNVFASTSSRGSRWMTTGSSGPAAGTTSRNSRPHPRHPFIGAGFLAESARHLRHEHRLRPRAEASQLFFKTVQNKMHWAAHGQTAAEVICRRADASQPHMGLTSWSGERRSSTRSTDDRRHATPAGGPALRAEPNGSRSMSNRRGLCQRRSPRKGQESAKRKPKRPEEDDS